MTIQPSPFLEKCSNSTITFIINVKKKSQRKSSSGFICFTLNYILQLFKSINR